MCRISFIAIMVLSIIEIIDVKAVVENTKDVNETLKYIFTTTFLYSASKKGIDKINLGTKK